MAAASLEAAGGITTGALRDDLTTPPSNAQYGTDLLANNINGPLALTTGAAETTQNKSPQWDALAGIKLHSNPPTASSTTVATGYVEWLDLQKGTAGPISATSSPVYADTLIDPWRVDINGATNAKPNVVTISGVGLYFPTLATEARGTISGVYVQPGTTSKCPAGGVELNLKQPLLLLNGAAAEAGIDNNTAGKPAYLCWASANNYVYPTTPQGLGATTGEIKNN
jgi:hypothetical protein